ncbi:tetratricopeptide repeat protein [Mumia quercus]|uniref:tetratricopeptide repeat protein n=1 Tax=Mumia quercus TaxID=2976125 RepID=UPI0021D1BFAA|nr:NB-ARC domain-containing protein [Mumia quercus]
MRERTRLARDESDTSYFFDLLYMGEMLLKIVVADLVAAVDDDRDHNRYALECRLVRADGIGEWAEVLEEVLAGPPSQLLNPAARETQRELSMNVGTGNDSWQRRAVDRLNEACHYLDADIPMTTRQKTSFRQWGRRFAWLRNRTRGHGAPKAGTLSRVCPALADSLDSLIEGAPTFARDWVHLSQTLSGKYRVSCFGGSRETFSYLAREAGHSFHDGVYIALPEPRPVALVRTDADLSDFFLPNGNYRKQRFEAISYITDETRGEDGAAWAMPIEARPRSETTAQPDLDVVGQVFSNMPPKREGYVPRPVLENDLRAVLIDERNPVITLQGRGGVGKTSLALEVLHELSNTQEFFAVVWFSARDIDLLQDGPKVVRADILSTEDVAKEFAGLMRPKEKLNNAGALQYFTDCLAGQAPDGPFLFVFDNFETIREQVSLYEYFNNAIRLPNKVLITTRTRDFKADYPIGVAGMARDEYHALVRETASSLGVLELVSEAYEDQLYEESDGHPYITKVLLGESARGNRKVSLKSVVATKDALLDALFDRSFSSLSLAGQRVFLTLCSWRSYVPRLGLEAVLLRPGNERLDVDGSIAELERASLVEVVEDSEGQTPFVSVPLAAALFGKRKLVTSPLKVAIDADLELVRHFGPVRAADVALGLAPRLDRLTRAVAKRQADGGDVDQEIAVLEYIASGYAPAWLNLARLQQETGATQEALASINRYLESAPQDGGAWRSLVALYRRVGDPLGEMHARLQLAELLDSDFEDLSSAAARLNGLISRREISLDADERRLMCQRLRRLMESRSAEADATDLSRLAWLCMNLQDVEAATAWVNAGLAIDETNGHCASLHDRLVREAEA